MKKIVCAMMVISLLVGVGSFALTASAAGERFTIGDIEYQVTADATATENGKVKVRTFSSSSQIRELTLPSQVVYDNATYDLTEIGGSSFPSNSRLTSITIPASVTLIGGSAFNSCGHLSSVTILGTSVVEGQAFRAVPFLANLVVAAGTTVAFTALSDSNLHGMSPLAAPGHPAWANGRASWGSVEGAVSYALRLYKDGVQVGDVFTTSGTGYDFTSAIQAEGAGSYTFHVWGLRSGNKNFSTFASSEAFGYIQSGNDDVHATRLDGVDGGAQYGADIIWGALEFTWREGSLGVWNTQEHVYEDGVLEGWLVNAPDGDLITVKNRSNAPVQASFSYQSEDGFERVGGSFSGEGVAEGKATLASADGKTEQTLPAVTAKLTLSGGLSATVTPNTLIGTVTVEITTITTNEGETA